MATESVGVRYLALFILLAMLVMPCAAIEQYCEMRNLIFTPTVDTTVPGNYYKLLNVPPVADQTILSVTVKNTDGPKAFGAWVSPPMTKTVQIEPAIWRARTNHYVSTTAGTSRVVFEVWNYTSAGTEMGPLWYNAWQTDDINTLSPDEYLTNYARRNGTWLFKGDRLMIKMYGNTTHSADVTISTTLLGNSNISYIEGGFFLCSDLEGSDSGTGGSGSEGLIMGIVGGLLGGILVIGRLKK